MIKHHEGALVMVKELFATPGAGQETDIFAFASDVEADQRMEIDRMGAMLAMLEGALAMRSVCPAVTMAMLLRCCSRPCAGAVAAGDDPRGAEAAAIRGAGLGPPGNMELACAHAQASGVFDPKPGGFSIRRSRRASASRRIRGEPTPPTPGTPAVERTAPAGQRPELRELGSRLPGRAPVRRQLQRLQHLRHRGSEESRG